MLNGLKLFLLVVFYFFLYSSGNAQVSKNDLKPLLSSSDQKNLDKIETTWNKGKSVTDEAEKLKIPGASDKESAKNEKKYTLKRLEASQYFQKANSQLSSLLNENISTFRKKNKNLPLNPNVRNKEDHAGELLRQARSIRGVSEDLTYPDEKLSKILEAEKIEIEANDILVKVLYAYLNRPLGYDELKYSSESTVKSDSVEIPTIQKFQPLSSVPDKISAPETQDTVVSANVPVQVQSEKEDVHEKMITDNSSGKLNQTDTTSLYGMVNVNEEQLDKFNKFLEVSYPDKYENYIIDFRNLNYRDIESLKQAWHLYLYAGNDEVLKTRTGKDSLQLLAVSGSDHMQDVGSSEIGDKNYAPEKTKIINSSEAINPHRKKTGGLDTEKVHESVSTPVIENEEIKKPEENIIKEEGRTNKVPAVRLTSGESSDVTNSENAKGFLYRVQISACRIPLDSASLKSVYHGDFPVLKLREENWYKYAVGEFNSYREAKQIKERIKVPGAFVIAYLNGKRISIPKSDDVLSFASNSFGITYKVQIIATKKQLGKNYISHIYTGSEKVEEILEEGWYKYAIVIGPSLDAAKSFIGRENIPGAFITSYLGDKKIELKDAIRLNKSKSIK